MFYLPENSHPLVVPNGKPWRPPFARVVSLTSRVDLDPEEALVDPEGRFGEGPALKGRGWWADGGYWAWELATEGRQGDWVLIVHGRHLRRTTDSTSTEQ